MLVKKFTILASVPLVCLALQPLTAQTASDSARIEKLERAVEQLQKRNAGINSMMVAVRIATARGMKDIVSPCGLRLANVRDLIAAKLRRS